MTFTAARGPLALRRWVATGHLLHGSPHAGLDELVPQALTHDPWVDHAGPVVYATDDPVIAVLFALLDREAWCGVLDVEVAPPGYRIAAQATAEPIRSTGTVWVVPRAAFRVLPGPEGGITQWASATAVRPVAAVPVTRRHLRVPVERLPPPPGGRHRMTRRVVRR